MAMPNGGAGAAWRQLMAQQWQPACAGAIMPAALCPMACPVPAKWPESACGAAMAARRKCGILAGAPEYWRHPAAWCAGVAPASRMPEYAGNLISNAAAAASAAGKANGGGKSNRRRSARPANARRPGPAASPAARPARPGQNNEYARQ